MATRDNHDFPVSEKAVHCFVPVSHQRRVEVGGAVELCVLLVPLLDAAGVDVKPLLCVQEKVRRRSARKERRECKEG